MACSNNSTPNDIDLDFIRFWAPLVWAFQFFCASHYSKFCRELRAQRRKCNWLRLAFCAQIAFTFTCIYFHFQMGTAISIYTIELTSSIFAYVNNVSYYCYFISNLFFPFETFTMRRTERRLYDTMRNTDSIFQHKLDYVIDYCVHRQIVKILLSFVTHHLWSVHHLSAKNAANFYSDHIDFRVLEWRVAHTPRTDSNSHTCAERSVGRIERANR